MDKTRRIALTLANRTEVKRQIDDMLQSDYDLLRNSRGAKGLIMACESVKKNPLIQEYIQVVEKEYSIPNPLNCPNRSLKAGSTKKINVFLGNSKLVPRADVQLSIGEGSGNKKRQYLTPSKQIHVYRSHQQPLPAGSKISLNPETYKKSIAPQAMTYSASRQNSQKREGNNISRPAIIHRQNLRSSSHINSKSKPTGINNKSVKKQMANNSSLIKMIANECENSTPQRQKDRLEGEVTSKKILIYDRVGETQMKQQNNTHKNPIWKLIKRKEADHVRSNKLSASFLKKQELKQRKTKESYRYCVGCEQPILQVNIRQHEKQCLQFQYVNGLSSNREVLAYLKQKIGKIQRNIQSKNQLLSEKDASEVRSKSIDLIDDYNKRRVRTKQCLQLEQHFDGLMRVGNRWCNAFEEIGKLRWFSRIVQKLQGLVLQETY